MIFLEESSIKKNKDQKLSKGEYRQETVFKSKHLEHQDMSLTKGEKLFQNIKWQQWKAMHAWEMGHENAVFYGCLMIQQPCQLAGHYAMVLS